MSYSNGMSIQEVADALGISRTRVKELESIALRKVKYQIERKFPALKEYWKELIPQTSQWDGF